MENNITNKSFFQINSVLNGNIKIKSSDSKLKELKDVSEKFEAIFLNQILKQSRQNKVSNGILDSKAEDTFNSLIDQEFSKSLSQKSNFGISEAIFNQFKTNIGSRK